MTTRLPEVGKRYKFKAFSRTSGREVKVIAETNKYLITEGFEEEIEVHLKRYFLDNFEELPDQPTSAENTFKMTQELGEEIDQYVAKRFSDKSYIRTNWHRDYDQQAIVITATQEELIPFDMLPDKMKQENPYLTTQDREYCEHVFNALDKAGLFRDEVQVAMEELKTALELSENLLASYDGPSHSYYLLDKAQNLLNALEYTAMDTNNLVSHKEGNSGHKEATCHNNVTTNPRASEKAEICDKSEECHSAVTTCKKDLQVETLKEWSCSNCGKIMTSPTACTNPERGGKYCSYSCSRGSKKPVEEEKKAKNICFKCGKVREWKDLVTSCDAFNSGHFCYDSCVKCTPVRSEKESIWKSVSELPNYTCDVVMKFESRISFGAFILTDRGDNFFEIGSEPIPNYGMKDPRWHLVDRLAVKQYCTLTDFINSIESEKKARVEVEERVRKLEERP